MVLPPRKMSDLRAAFVRKNLSVTTVAQRVGISRGHLSDVLHGRARMTERLARNISMATTIPLSVVLGEREEAAV